MNTYDFYAVKLHASTKTAIYQTLGGRTPEIARRVVAKVIGTRYGYPLKSYEFMLGCVDMVCHPNADSALKRAEEIAAGYELADGARVHVHYVARD